VIGVREDGEKELLAVEDGYRESTESWAGVFRDMKRRGLNEPKLVVGDGALGAWAALRDVYPGAGEQRCWFHASGNIIDCLPTRLHSRAKGLLSGIIEAPTRRDAKLALEVFREEYGAKYPKALAKLDRDWTQLTAFDDYPAEHWRHLRTTDESVKRGGFGSGVNWGDGLVAAGARRPADRRRTRRFGAARLASPGSAPFGRAGASSRRGVVCGRVSAGVTLRVGVVDPGAKRRSWD